jgi:inner membrane protein involved in colicin E2 resistance
LIKCDTFGSFLIKLQLPFHMTHLHHTQGTFKDHSAHVHRDEVIQVTPSAYYPCRGESSHHVCIEEEIQKQQLQMQFNMAIDLV